MNLLKLILFSLSFLGVLVVSISSSYALLTYVGIEIVNLTDDPEYSCAGFSGDGANGYPYDYGDQGRIRGLSSYPSLGRPLFFNLTYVSNRSEIWSGNSTVDVDYERGDIIYLPQQVDLQSGEDYKLFIDVDMVKLYLPITNTGSYVSPVNNIHWTDGVTTTEGETVISDSSSSNVCNGNYDSVAYLDDIFGVYLGKTPEFAVNKPCFSDSINSNCDDENRGIAFAPREENQQYQFRMSGYEYFNLSNSTKGNFNFQFTY